MIYSDTSAESLDNDDMALGLLAVAITIFYVGLHQGVRYKVIFSAIVVVELSSIGLLWWALRGIAPCW